MRKPTLIVEATGKTADEHLADVRNLRRLAAGYADVLDLAIIASAANVPATIEAVSPGCVVGLKTSPLFAKFGRDGWWNPDAWRALGGVIARLSATRVVLENESVPGRHVWPDVLATPAERDEAAQDCINVFAACFGNVQRVMFYPFSPDAPIDMSFAQAMVRREKAWSIIDSASWWGPTELGQHEVIARRERLNALGLPVVSLPYVLSRTGAPKDNNAPRSWGLEHLATWPYIAPETALWYVSRDDPKLLPMVLGYIATRTAPLRAALVLEEGPA